VRCALAIIAARAHGAAEIVATDVMDADLVKARQVSADRLINVASHSEQIDTHSANKGYSDVHFEASGNERAVRSGLEVLRLRGVLVQLDLGGDVSIPQNMVVAKEIEMRGTFRLHEEFGAITDRRRRSSTSARRRHRDRGWRALFADDPLAVSTAEHEDDEEVLADEPLLGGLEIRAGRVKDDRGHRVLSRSGRGLEAFVDPLSERCFIHLPLGQRQPFEQDLLVARDDLEAVQSHEQLCHDQRNPLVSIDEGMVLGEAKGIRSGHVRDVRPAICEEVLRPCQCGVEQSVIPQTGRSAVLGQLLLMQGEHDGFEHPHRVIHYFASSRSTFRRCFIMRRAASI